MSLEHHSEKTVFLGETSQGLPIEIRYPRGSDVKVMCRHINSLSQEKTFIRFQGETFSLKDEEKYLRSQLELIAKNKAVVLLAFSGKELIGIGDITMNNLTERHIGVLGIALIKSYRGIGVGSLLMQLLMNEAVRSLPGLEILTLCLFSNNTVGAELYRKFGFIEYGVLPGGIKLPGEYADQILLYKKVTVPEKSG